MPPFPFVYINADGTARELHAGERVWLETDYALGDGGAPYVKSSYDKRNGWGELNGYLAREDLPAGMPVAAAPAEDPSRPMPYADYVALLKKRGVRPGGSGGG